MFPLWIPTGTGQFRKGKRSEVDLTVINYLAAANDVTYTVSTSDSLVTLIQSSGTLGSVLSGQESVTRVFLPHGQHGAQ